MKLTIQERAWLHKLQVLLDACPSERIGFYTIGDPDVSIYDRTKDEEIDDLMDRGNHDFGYAVEKAGAGIEPAAGGSVYFLRFPANVHSVAG